MTGAGIPLPALVGIGGYVLFLILCLCGKVHR